VSAPTAPLVDGAEPVSEGTARAARNVVVVTLAELAGKVATLVFTVVVARSLSPAGFGAFSYALALGLLLATVPTWGFDTVLLRRGSADRADLGPAFAQTLALRTVLAVPVLVLGAVAGTLGRPTAEAKVAVVLVLLASLADAYAEAARTAAGALERRGLMALAVVVQRLANAGLAVALLAAGGGLLSVCAAYLGSALVGLALSALVLRHIGIAPTWSAVDRASLAEMWRASFVLGVDTLVAMALFRLDAVLLGALDGDEAVAAYAVAYRLLETVLFVTWAVTRATFPAMARAAQDGEDEPVVRATERGLAVVAAVFVPYGVVLLAEGGAVLHLLFGDAYLAESTVALRWLAFAPLAFALAYVGSNALAALQRNRVLLLSSVAAAVVNVVGNLVAIPYFSTEGAAAMTLLAFTLEGGLVIAALQRSAGLVRLDRALRVPVLAAVPLLVLLLGLHLPVLAECALGGALYLLCWVPLATRLAPDQVAVVRTLVRR